MNMTSRQRLTLTLACTLTVVVVALQVFVVCLSGIMQLQVQPLTGSSVGTVQQLQNSLAFSLLRTASEKAARRPDNSSSRVLQANASCQLSHNDVSRILAAAAEAEAEADGIPIRRGSAHTRLQGVFGVRAVTARRRLKAEWQAVLRPFAGKPSSTPSRCRSVGLIPQHAVSQPSAGSSNTRSSSSTSLLLVLGSWDGLDRMLGLYSVNLFSIWSYARLHGYGLQLYVHDEPLPYALPVFYIKVLGVRHLFDVLGYSHVLYLDFDTFTSPHSAPPLSLFYGEFPSASLLLQAEQNLCAAALLWRNTADADMLLQAWWDTGAAGCCPNFPHDQTALKHMVLAYVANITEQGWVYSRAQQRFFKLPDTPPPAAATAPMTSAASPQLNQHHRGGNKQLSSKPGQQREVVLSRDHLPHRVSSLLRLQPLLQSRHSAVGFVGLEGHYPSWWGSRPSRVVLTNCLGMWWGCVPFDTPALLYHTGHWAMEGLKSTPWLAERLLRSLADWNSIWVASSITSNSSSSSSPQELALGH